MTPDEAKALAEIEALMLRAMHRKPMTHREIARRLEISNGDEWNIYQRALAKLRKYATRGES